MDKDVKLGSVGDLDISIASGVAKVSLGLQVDAAALGVSASVSVSAMTLLDKLFAAIEAASPAGAVPIEEGAKSILKAAVAAL